jgi:hypothetical protein
MSAMQKTDGEDPSPRRQHRRLAIARHASGSNAMGWMLLGFVLGAGAAIAVLMNADFARQAAQAPYSVRLSLTPRVTTKASRPAALILKPAPLEAVLAPAIALPTQPIALASASPAPPASPSPPAKPASRSPIRKSPLAGAVTQVTEDAAAVGMTSHTDSRPNDLF